MQSVSANKRKTGWMIGLVSGGVVLVIAAVVLIILFTRAASITGAWHNETLNQQIRFHGDNTVVIQSQYGTYEAAYVFDSGSKKGVISLNGKSIEFVLRDDRMVLSSEGQKSAFVREEMKIEAIETPTPVDTSTPTPIVT